MITAHFEFPLFFEGSARTTLLRGDIIRRLGEDDSLNNFEENYDVDFAIVPAFLSEDRDEDVVLSVKVITALSDRNNFIEEKEFVGQVEGQFSRKILVENGMSFGDKIMDLADECLTTHSKNWEAEGISGGSGIRWDEGRRIFSSVRRYDFSRFDLR